MDNAIVNQEKPQNTPNIVAICGCRTTYAVNLPPKDVESLRLNARHQALQTIVGAADNLGLIASFSGKFR